MFCASGALSGEAANSGAAGGEGAGEEGGQGGRGEPGLQEGRGQRGSRRRGPAAGPATHRGADEDPAEGEGAGGQQVSDVFFCDFSSLFQ